MRLPDLTFDPGTANMNGYSQAALASTLKGMKRFPYMQIEIACYGQDTSLARKQAEAVKSYLENNSIQGSRIEALGKPIPPNGRTEPSIRRID
jgi:outer membrane protein OmpA-like peptidoglycan-associated protein